jgi:hypothetical protein
MKYFDNINDAKLWHLTNQLYYNCPLNPTFIFSYDKYPKDGLIVKTPTSGVQYYFRFVRQKDYNKHHKVKK